MKKKIKNNPYLNEITFQTFTDTYKRKHENNELYTQQYHQLTKKIAQYLQTPHQNIIINIPDKIITINIEQDRLLLLTLQKLIELTEYLGVEDIRIYTPSRNTLIINYNNKEEEEKDTWPQISIYNH